MVEAERPVRDWLKAPALLAPRVVVETPVKLTEKQKELLRELERSTTEGGAKHNPQRKSWKDKVKEFFE